MPTPVEYVARDGTRTWRVRVRAHGRYTSETFTDQRSAARWCSLVAAVGPEAAIAQRARTDAADTAYVPTLAQWLTTHVAELTGVTDRTRLDYAAMARRTWLPLLADRRLDTIDRPAITATIRALETQGLAPKSIANTHGLLSSVLTSAVIAGHIRANPCTGVRLPPAQHNDRDRFLTHEEFARLCAHTPTRHHPLLMLLFGTGLRWSEATALTVHDLTLTTHPPTIRVTKAWKATPGRPRQIGPPKSPKSRRTVMLPDQLVDLLAPLCEGRAPGDLLIRTPLGHAVHHGNWRSRVWVPACQGAGLDPAPRIHDARHTHASWLIEQGATLEMVQDQLGHESILTTRRVYGHLQPAMRQALGDFATKALGTR